MAYHTRRSGPQGIGRGTPPPMLYSQQRSSARAPTSSYGNSRNTSSLSSSLSSSMSSSLSSSSNYQSNMSQSQPPLSNNSNYHHQHQSQHPLQQQQIHQKQMPLQDQPMLAPPRQEYRPKDEPMQQMGSSIVPPPPPPPSFMGNRHSEERADSGDAKGEEENGEPRGKPWIKKKMPGFKVNKKVKRRRQNARLRKILQPKNAIMVLNELKSGIKFTFQDHTNSLNPTFMVTAEIDGKTFTGQGISKPLAKQEAAENALKDLLLQKMSDAALKVASPEVETTPEAMAADTASSVGDNDSVDGTTETGKPGAPEDEVPWGSLASFALYKLFTEWQSQGTHVHITKAPSFSQGQPAKPSAPAPMKKIPDNPTERHPVMLLNQLKPGVEFKEVNREGTPPNLVFTLSVTIDGSSYNGVAKNKKDAKKEAAKAALAGAFNIKYD